MKAEDIHVFDVKCPADGAVNWWAAKCRRCGVFITKYDHSRAECLEVAVKIGCRCAD